jgi:hypothetical protein
MFDVVLTRFLNLSQRRGMHADEIIEQIVDREGASFETKAAVRVAVSDAEAVTGTSAGASDDAVAATPAQQGVCQSWLANGSCRLYGNGDCPHGHPPRQRGAYATNPRPGPYDRPGNGGSKVLLDELGLRHEQVIRPRDGDVRLVVCNGLEER